MNYDDGSFDYVDGPGLTKIRGKKEMERYLKNQFDFSKQILTVEEHADPLHRFERPRGRVTCPNAQVATHLNPPRTPPPPPLKTAGEIKLP